MFTDLLKHFKRIRVRRLTYDAIFSQAANFLFPCNVY